MSPYTDLKVKVEQADRELRAMAAENKMDLNKERRLAALQVEMARAKEMHAEELKLALRRRFSAHPLSVERYIQEAEWQHGGAEYWACFSSTSEVFADFRALLHAAGEDA